MTFGRIGNSGLISSSVFNFCEQARCCETPTLHANNTFRKELSEAYPAGLDENKHVLGVSEMDL